MSFSLLPARMKTIKAKMKVLQCSHYGDFFRRLREANSADLIKKEGTNVFTTLYINFSDAQGQITPESLMVSG